MAELQRERGLERHAAPELVHPEKDTASQRQLENANVDAAEKGSL